MISLTVSKEIPFSEGERAAVKCYGANDVMEGVAIMKKEDVQCSITGNSTNSSTRTSTTKSSAFIQTKRSTAKSGSTP